MASPLPRSLSRSLVPVAIALLGLWLPHGVRAGDPPSLGAQLTPAPLYANETREITVRSKATVPTTYSVAVAGAGWRVSPTTFQLLPGEQETLTVDQVGSEPGEVRVTAVATHSDAIVQEASITLGTQLYDAKPSPLPPAWLVLCLVALAGVSVGISALWAKRRGYRRRHVP